MKGSNRATAARGSSGELGLAELVAIGVGGMIGGGIFSILGLAVDVAGHAAPLAFGIGSAIAFAAGYSYVRLALTYRGDGASFTYLERAFPRTPSIAGVAGWTVVFGYIGTLALYAFTFGAYASHLLGLDPSAFARAALLGGALIFVAYEGFQLITNAVCETRDPERTIPRGLFGSIAITSLIYMAVALVAVGNLDVASIHAAQEYALAAVAEPVLGRLGVVLVDVAAMLATASAMNATIFGASHLAFEIANDHLAPSAFSHRNRSGVPLPAAAAITLASIGLTAFGGLELIASFSSLTFLLVSIAVCVANFRLREQTRSSAVPIVVALILMALTVALLLLYLAENDRGALYFALSAYAGTGLSFLLFRVVAGRRRRTSE